MSRNQYELAAPGDRTPPTIINRETRMSVLALDTRTVNGKEFHTPVFADDETAALVLAALNQANRIPA